MYREQVRGQQPHGEASLVCGRNSLEDCVRKEREGGRTVRVLAGMSATQDFIRMGQDLSRAVRWSDGNFLAVLGFGLSGAR